MDLGRVGIWTAAFDQQPAARAQETAAHPWARPKNSNGKADIDPPDVPARAGGDSSTRPLAHCGRPVGSYIAHCSRHSVTIKERSARR